MLTTSSRVLGLLALLQARREWSGNDLSRRLEVDIRTIRRDVDRLRALGYVIHASTGPGGGYRLGSGAATPPLLLDDDEAIAVALALNTTASTVTGPQDAALRALVKLDQLLPTRLKRKWNALHAVTLSLASGHVIANPKTLTTVATACRDQRRLQFKYEDRAGKALVRDVEPMRLVHTGMVWYLVAWDVVRANWRTFRIDRIDSKTEVKQGAVFTPRTPPEDFLAMVSRSIASVPYRYRVRLKLSEPLTAVKKKVPQWLGSLESIDASHSLLTIGADSYELLTSLIARVDLDFELYAADELRQPILNVLKRLTQNVRGKSKH